jgi:hypothetical protein
VDDQLPLSAAWLNDLGFSIGNPFSARLLPDEPESVLIQYFVPRAGYNDVVGSARHPQSAFLCGPRGAGKTINRRALEALCHAGRLDAPVMPVVYTDFEGVLNRAGSPDSVTAMHHVEQILRVGLEGLFNNLAEQTWRATPFVRGLRRKLAAYLTRFTSLLDEQMLDLWLADRGMLSDQCNTESLRAGKIPGNSPFLELVAGVLQYSTDFIRPVEKLPLDLLRGFVDLARRAEYETVYVLVDGVDEREPMAGDPEQAAALLAPLITNLGFMELKHLAFKFFIMPEVLAALKRRRSFREDKLIIREISWDETGLRELLDRRVEVFSENALPSLDAIAERGNVVERLVVAADGLPRNALRLGEWLLYYHTLRVGPGGAFTLTEEDVRRAIAGFTNRAKEEALFGSEHQPSSTGATPVIRFDEAQQVWVGSKCVGHLSAKLSLLLTYLLANDGYYRSYDEIGRYVHQDEWTLEGRTNASIDKLVDRLRKALQLGEGGSEIIKKRPDGYLFRQPPLGDFV